MNEYSRKILRVVSLLLDELADDMEAETTPPPAPSKPETRNAGFFGGLDFKSTTPGSYLAGLETTADIGYPIRHRHGASGYHVHSPEDYRNHQLPIENEDQNGLDSSDCECERWRDGITTCPVHGTTKPVPVVTYAIPGPPPTEHKVTNGFYTWKRRPDGDFDMIDAAGVDPAPRIPESWEGLLFSHGSLTLVPWTAEDLEEHRIYGPPGARWGHPDQPCPWYHHYDEMLPDGQGQGSCSLGRGHIGPHIDQTGRPLGETAEATGPADANITPHEASATPCLCGHPAEHQPGCPRYTRLTGQGAHPPIDPLNQI